VPEVIEALTVRQLLSQLIDVLAFVGGQVPLPKKVLTHSPGFVPRKKRKSFVPLVQSAEMAVVAVE